MTQQQNSIACQQEEERRFNQLATKRQGVYRCIKYTSLYKGYDAKLWSGSTPVMAEIKTRDYDMPFFSKYGPYLERVKLQNMIMEFENVRDAKNVLASLFYFCFTNDGHCLVYSLKPEINAFVWVRRKLPKDDFSRELVWKWVAELKYPYEVWSLD